MALDYSTENMGMLKILYEGSCEQSVDCDITLPDYCADISRVLKCCIIPEITSDKISGDRVCVDGNALVRIIYADENDNICTCEQNYPFSKFIQSGDDAQGALETNVSVQYTNCRAINKRRAEIHSQLHIRFKISAPCGYECINKIADTSVQTKTENFEISSLCAVESKNFTLGETAELPPDYLPVERIIACYATPVINETKAAKDKILIKGEVGITVIYCSDNNPGNNATFCHTIPVSQVIDIQGADENSVVCVRMKIQSCQCKTVNDVDSVSRLIEINCIAAACIKAYTLSQISCITDAYSIDGQLQTNYESRQFLKLDKNLKEISVQKFTIDLNSLDGQKICCIWWDKPDVNKNIHDGKLSLHTVVPINIIAIDSENRPVFCQREVNFEFSRSIDSQRCIISDEDVIPTGFNITSFTGGKADIKGEFIVSADIFSVSQADALISADVAKGNKSRSSCVVVYFPDKEETLWDIARKFNTTTDMIKEQNSVISEIVTDEKPLLIPVIKN